MFKLRHALLPVCASLCMCAVHTSMCVNACVKSMYVHTHANATTVACDQRRTGAIAWHPGVTACRPARHCPGRWASAVTMATTRQRKYCYFDHPRGAHVFACRGFSALMFTCTNASDQKLSRTYTCTHLSTNKCTLNANISTYLQTCAYTYTNI